MRGDGSNEFGVDRGLEGQRGVSCAHLRWFTRPVRDCIDSCCVAAIASLGYLKERLRGWAAPLVCDSLERQ
jgi:hypothetical protein